MLLDELIKNLQEKLQTHGNVRVLTNGEHGRNDEKILTEEMISIAPAHMELNDPSVFDFMPDDILCYIGGY